MRLVPKTYIAQCDKNLTRAGKFKDKLKLCQRERTADKGASHTKDKTIVQLTNAGVAKNKRIIELELRWPWYRWVAVGVASAACGVFAVSMFDDGAQKSRIVSGVMCGLGSLILVR